MAQKIILKHAKKSYQGKRTLEVLEGANDYNTWIAESLLPYLASPVLEVGAGTGNITKFFLSKKPLTITDIDTSLLQHLKSKFTHVSQTKIFHLDVGKRPSKHLHESFNSIVAVNVLEHIEEDVAALTHMKLMLKKKGVIVILVPAKKIAYTRLDKSLGHFRRYEKEELQEKLTKAGFRVEKLYYFNFLGLFTWMLRDKISQTHTDLSPTHIALFDKIVYVLKVIERFLPIPIGISLIAVGRNEK